MNTPVALRANAKERIEMLCPSVSRAKQMMSTPDIIYFSRDIVLNDRIETDQVSLVLHIALFLAERTQHGKYTEATTQETEKRS